MRVRNLFGYGDCILLQNENGYISLIDGGSDLESEFSGDQYRIRAIDFLKSQQISHLNAVFISHIHEDHVCGLEKVLKNVSADVIYIPYPLEVFRGARPLTPLPDAARSVPLYTEALNAFIRILHLAEQHGIPVKTLQAGDTITLTEQITAQVLAPRKKGIRAIYRSFTADLRREYYRTGGNPAADRTGCNIQSNQHAAEDNGRQQRSAGCCGQLSEHLERSSCFCTSKCKRSQIAAPWTARLCGREHDEADASEICGNNFRL